MFLLSPGLSLDSARTAKNIIHLADVSQAKVDIVLKERKDVSLLRLSSSSGRALEMQTLGIVFKAS